MVEGVQSSTAEALVPRNYSPLTKSGKKSARMQDQFANSEGFERAVGASTGAIGAGISEAAKQNIKDKTDLSSQGQLLIKPTVEEQDATRTVILRPLPQVKS